MMHRPVYTLLFVLALVVLMGLAGWFFPPEGIKLGNDLVLKFPSPRDLFSEPEQKADISKVLEAVNKIDTTFRIDEPGEAIDTAAQVMPAVQLNMNLQYTSSSALKKFFDAIHRLRRDKTSVRVLHYGDSQIEADRITDYIRLKLQQQFGGNGPGLISLVPLTWRAAAHVSTGDEGWDRYTVFTAPDKRVPHKAYGVRGAFSRFLPYAEITDSSVAHTTTLQVSTPASLQFSRIRLFYGGAKRSTWCEFYDGPALISADSLSAGGIFNTRDYEVGRGSNKQIFSFTGLDSPDFYAMSLEGNSGVMVDNIAMRGSSGTFFHRVNQEQMKMFYRHLNVKLIILQFGGNALPGLRDSAMAVNYSKYMRYQLKQVKKLAPDASIIFIGPADMSVKEGTSYVTYPLLVPLRDHLRQVVLDAGCVYFDLFDVMGGKNSMPEWVAENLAGKDYTHFTSKGARKIATLFYAALINEYNNYIHALK